MLLERDDQLAVLAAQLAAADGGSGSMVLIAGEAGAGKSSLVADFTEPLGSRAVIGSCDPLSAPAPLSPLRDIVDLGALSSDDQVVQGASVPLFAQVLERFGAAASATVMVLEDLHWADQATLDFVRYAGRRVANHRLVVLCTYRDDEISVGHPFQAVLGQMARLPTTVLVKVPRLTIDAVRILTESIDLDPEVVHRLTSGNAFFVSEIIAGGGQPPDSLSDAVLARLVDLRPAVRRVIETVSISPRSLEVQRTLALGNNSDDVDEAVASGVIQATGTQLRFRHDLARSIVQHSVPPGRRLELHRAMIGLLLVEDDQDHARLAHHAIEAGDPALIAVHAPVAAQEAEARGAGREVVALARAALVHEDELEPDIAARLRFDLGVRLTELDDPAAGLEQIELARRRFADGGLFVLEAQAWRYAGRALSALGLAEEARDAYWRAVELAGREGPSAELVLALGSVAADAMLARQPLDGLPHADRAVAMAEGLGLRSALRVVQHTKACLVLISGDEDRGLELLQRSAEEMTELGAAREVMALVNLGSGAGEVRRYPVASDALVDAESLGIENDIDSSVAYARAWLARVAFE